jgi:hypothetical protein
MIGSLRAIWPWQSLQYADIDGKEVVVGRIWEIPTLSQNGAGEIGLAIVCLMVGFGLVFGLSHLANRKEERA